ncbi:hypothetical protein MAM1_0071c04186 [Mucor ambiguus]|uniref:Uncharacterized protein n=1 Tax=Mucor ambiguus TaxID=91626 RepID=A0A0C9MNG3_9FUNG|nr:hypothetical protein MAM1_0071c04186 [Mucor ambiguus]
MQTRPEDKNPATIIKQEQHQVNADVALREMALLEQFDASICYANFNTLQEEEINWAQVKKELDKRYTYLYLRGLYSMGGGIRKEAHYSLIDEYTDDDYYYHPPLGDIKLTSLN